MTTVLIPAQKVEISQIAVTDKFTMARTEMESDSILRCAEIARESSGKSDPFLMKGQEEHPTPITLFLDGDGVYWIGDGRHRIMGCDKAGWTDVWAVVMDGTKTDALQFALGCNEQNGNPLKTRDNTLRVKKQHILNPEWSDSRIAKKLGVSESTVQRIRTKLMSSDGDRVTKQVAKEIEKPAKTPEQAKTQTSELKQAVRAKAQKTPKSAPKPKPASSKVTDSNGPHAQEVKAKWGQIEKADDAIKTSLSALVKAVDARLELTQESDMAQPYHDKIIQQLDLVLIEWNQWKQNG